MQETQAATHDIGEPGSRVLIFDTTLRDGEQSPGASLTSAEKLEVARLLAGLQVDVLEAGFPAASPDDEAAVRAVAQEVGSEGGPVIAGLARTCENDLDAAWRAVAPAARPRIHTFLATSDLHIEHKLRSTRAAVLQQIRDMVGYARSLCADVEFSPEDASRSDRAFLVEALAAAIEAGATTLNIPDTVGYTTPEEMGALIRYLRENTAGSEDVVWSVHCHDDLGLATANTLAGLAAGARQAEVTLNGIGERAGNTSLEEVVMALATRRPIYALATGIVTERLLSASRLVSRLTGMPVPPNKAVVGANAFAHEAGIHQDGLLKDRRTYEIMTPESVGCRSRLVLGKHSGRHAFVSRLGELGVELPRPEADRAFRRFKELADRKKEIGDGDLLALVADAQGSAENTYKLRDLQVVSCRPGLPTATVRLAGPSGDRVASAVGAGPVEAVFQAVQQALGQSFRVQEYRLESASSGADAQAEASVRLGAEDGGDSRGFGADVDVIVASARAYLAAANRLLPELEDDAPTPLPNQIGVEPGAAAALERGGSA